MKQKDQIFLNRLNEHPELRERMEALLNMVDNETGNFTKANDAEQYRSEGAIKSVGNYIKTMQRLNFASILANHH